MEAVSNLSKNSKERETDRKGKTLRGCAYPYEWVRGREGGASLCLARAPTSSVALYVSQCVEDSPWKWRSLGTLLWQRNADFIRNVRLDRSFKKERDRVIWTRDYSNVFVKSREDVVLDQFDLAGTTAATSFGGNILLRQTWHQFKCLKI